MATTILSNMIPASGSQTATVQTDSPNATDGQFAAVFSKLSLPADHGAGQLTEDANQPPPEPSQDSDIDEENTQLTAGAPSVDPVPIKSGVHATRPFPSSAGNTVKAETVAIEYGGMGSTPVAPIPAQSRGALAGLQEHPVKNADESKPQNVGEAIAASKNTANIARVPLATLLEPATVPESKATQNPSAQTVATSSNNMMAAAVVSKTPQQASPNHVNKADAPAVQPLNLLASVKTTTPLNTVTAPNPKTPEASVHNTVTTPYITTGASKPMSMLERHLGGHAVTLGSGPQSSAPVHFFPLQTGKVVDSSWAADRVLGSPLPATSTNTKSAQVSATPSFPITGGKPMLSMTQPDRKILETSSTASAPIADPEMGPTLAATNVPMVTTAPKTDLAGSVMQQVAEHVRTTSGTKIEIALSPVELGRVRIILSPSDAGLMVNVLADRPETLDLMRRHIDDLGKSFADLGYEDIAFSFGQNDQTPNDETLRDIQPNGMELSEDSEPSVQPTLTQHPHLSAISTDGVDMRL